MADSAGCSRLPRFTRLGRKGIAVSGTIRFKSLPEKFHSPACEHEAELDEAGLDGGPRSASAGHRVRDESATGQSFHLVRTYPRYCRLKGLIEKRRRTQPPTYILLRISIIPWSILLTPIVDRTPHSLLSIWSAFLAGFSLLLASIPSERQFTLGNTILGVLSSMFVALFPVLLLRTYDTFGDSTFQRPIASGFDPESGNSADQPKQDELRVFWLVIRLTVWISTALLAVVLLFSGELLDIFSNCYVLDMKILWCLIWGSGMLTGTVIILTLMLARRTSAAVATFLFVPESGLGILILNRFSITLSNWTDIIMCWFSSVCFMVERGKESTTKVTGSAQRFYYALRTIILPLVVYASVHYIAHLSQAIFFPSHVSDHAPHIPLDLTRLNRTEIMYRVKDDYLGTRPHVDTVADLSLMVNRCNEIDGGKGVDDVVNCLSYLSSAEYLTLPAAGNGMRASEQDPRKADFVNADGHGNTLTRYIPPSQARAPTDTSIGTCAGPIIPFHVYWTGSASWRVELFIKAYLYTQNLPCSRLWLWVDCDIDSDCVDKMLIRDPIFQRFRPLVDRGDLVVKAWRFPLRIPLPSESNRTDEDNYSDTSDSEEGGARVVGKGIYQDAKGQQWLMLNPTHLAFSPVVVSDAVRFIVLHQHGGLYCDMDVLLMRDMRPLLLPDPVTGPRPFAEQWVERCHPADYNTAVISLPANSSLSSYLLHGGLRMGLNFHPKVIGRMLWRDGRNGELKMLHNAVFDPLVTNLRREGTNTCTVPCHKNFHGAFMSRVEEASQEWSNYRGELLPTPNVTSLVGDFGSQHWDLPPTNRTMENFFHGAWAYHIHNQVCGYQVLSRTPY